MKARRNTAMAMAAIAALMLGAAFAAVPLYDLFCRVSGPTVVPSRSSISANKASSWSMLLAWRSFTKPRGNGTSLAFIDWYLVVDCFNVLSDSLISLVQGFNNTRCMCVRVKTQRGEAYPGLGEASPRQTTARLVPKWAEEVKRRCRGSCLRKYR